MRMKISGLMASPEKGKRQEVIVDFTKDIELTIDHMSGITFVQFGEDVWVLDTKSIEYDVISK